jgi:hypothetical protein
VRRFLAPIVFLFIAALAGASLWAAPADISTTTIHSRRLGIYTYSNGLVASTGTFNTQLNLVRNDIGMKLSRFNSDYWGTVEASSGVFTYSKLDDAIYTATVTYGVDLVIMTPFAASWTPDHPSCAGGVNPFSGGALATTHCQTSDYGVVYRFNNNVASRKCNAIQVWEIGNEPDLLYGSTAPAVYVAYATTTIKAIWDACPGTEITLPALASPKNTIVNGAIDTTTYTDHLWFAQFLDEFEPAMTDIDATVTLSSFTYSIHVYQDAAGGGQTLSLALSTAAAVLNNRGHSNVVFNVTEYGKFGGSYGSGDEEAEEVGKSSTTLKFIATGMSSTSPIVKRMIYHNLDDGFDFSALGEDGSSERYVYKTLKKAVSVLEGATASGDTGSGNLKAYKFIQPDGDAVYITWCDAASCSWTPTPQPASGVAKTSVYGVDSSIARTGFAPYTVDREPGIYVFSQTATAVRGVRATGVNYRNE